MKAPFSLSETNMTLEKQKNRRISDNKNTDISVAKPIAKMCVFGTCLDSLMENSSAVAVPFVLSRLCCYIEKHGLLQQNLNEETKELFEVDFLKKEFDESGDASLELRGNVFVAMKLLRLFLEELPEPLIPATMHAAFFSMKQRVSSSSDCIKHLKSLVDHLPDSAFCVLKYLSHFLLQMTKHEESNGLNPVNLSFMFGPVIFRPNKKDPLQWIVIRNITHCFMVDYYAIFEKDINNSSNYKNTDLCKQRQVAPLPSSVGPIPSMEPLSVEIPVIDTLVDPKIELHIQQDFPVLSIQKRDEKINNIALNCINYEENFHKEIKFSLSSARKRKETLLTADVVLFRNSVHKISTVFPIEKSKIHSDHESVTSNSLENVFSENSDCLFPNKLVHENYNGGHSPHPPDPKRRELEFFDNKKTHVDEKYRTHQRNFVKYYNDAKVISTSKRSPRVKKNLLEKSHISVDSFLHNELQIPVNCTANDTSSDFSSKNVMDDHSNSLISEITRPVSCPVPDADNCDLETSQSSLSHSWSTLFEAEEPVVSNRHFNWHAPKNSEEETEAVSPLVQHFRSSERDSSVAPSPSVEQDHFLKSPVKEDTFSVPIKQLMKKIRGLKKKLHHFDEKYESDYGYKPSHAEKTNYPEAKKLLNELHKARKDLKELKDEYHLISASNVYNNWLPTRDVHILEDTTNCLKETDHQNIRDYLKKSKYSMQKSWDETLKCLDGDRKLAKRPELIEDMTSDQVKDEKLAIQKALLHFESIHGKPSRKTDRNTIRPLYERYRNIKRLLVKSNSFPVSSTKAAINSLEPIMEHETMDFRASIGEIKLAQLKKDKSCDFTDAINQDIKKDINSQSMCFQFLDNKYKNSSLHELPLPEMIFQQHQVRLEKRRIRKILREFEDEFMKVNGRKIQKEDKTPVESLYEEYKLIKAHLRLLEALISKHHLEHAND